MEFASDDEVDGGGHERQNALKQLSVFQSDVTVHVLHQPLPIVSHASAFHV